MAQKTSHTQRLLLIKELLGNPITVKKLQEKLLEKGIKISERQLYRNIDEIKRTLLVSNETINSAPN